MSCMRDEICVLLDGDDWLNGENVLARLNEIYEEEDCWLTYGSYIEYPSGRDSSFDVSTKRFTNDYDNKVPGAGHYELNAKAMNANGAYYVSGM